MQSDPGYLFAKIQKLQHANKFKDALGAVGYADSVVKLGTISEGSVVTNTVTMDIPRVAEMNDTDRDNRKKHRSPSLREHQPKQR